MTNTKRLLLSIGSALGFTLVLVGLAFATLVLMEYTNPLIALVVLLFVLLFVLFYGLISYE